LLSELKRRYRLTDVAGHEHMAPGRKQDPGAGFEWMRLIDALGWPDRHFPAGVVHRG
jgi:N-acetyl-anhydromuramoyl-L-alanine amidase